MSQPERPKAVGSKIMDRLKRPLSRFTKKNISSSSPKNSAKSTGNVTQVPRTDLAAASTSTTTEPTRTSPAGNIPQDAPIGQQKGLPDEETVLEPGGLNNDIVPLRRIAAENFITTPDNGGSNSDLAGDPLSLGSSNAGTVPEPPRVVIKDVGTKENGDLNNSSSIVDDKLWYSERMPVWNEAVGKWKSSNVKEFDELMRSVKGAANDSVARGSVDWLAELRPAVQSSKQTAAKLKRWLPVLASVRGIAMAASAADPHKIAPIVCASVLFGLDIFFNCMNPEDRDKIIDILCQCGATITECNNFEINFMKASHPSIKSKISKVNEILGQQYTTALNLVYKLRHACQIMQWEFGNSETSYSQDTAPTESQATRFSKWFKRRGALLWTKMSNEVLNWEGGSKELARLKVEWSVRKDDLKETIAADDHIGEARDWLRKKDSPDPSPDDIKDRVMQHDGYRTGADWFLKGDDFAVFCDGFRSMRSAKRAVHTQGSTGSPSELQNIRKNSAQEFLAERVLWLYGGYGTGKTTILYLTYLDLSTATELQLEASREIRVVPYFCNGAEVGTKRADCETIIRAMIRRMALMPDFTLAKPANDMYNKHKSMGARDEELTLDKHWLPLFEELIGMNVGKCHFVLLIDGLDECDDPAEWEKLLSILNSFIRKYPNVSLICSSHAHVEVDQHFTSYREERRTSIVLPVRVTGEKTAVAIEAYIAGELTRREVKARTSVFYQNKTLLEEFKTLLLSNAEGNFRWIEIWLELMVPETTVRGKKGAPIRSEEHARDRLKELKEDVTPKFDPKQRLTKAYQRLWDLNLTSDLEFAGETLRTRLFQLVQVAREPLNADGLSAILRIQSKAYASYPTASDVKSMFANFLEEYEPVSYEFHIHSAGNIANLTYDRNLEEGAEELIDTEGLPATPPIRRDTYASFPTAKSLFANFLEERKPPLKERLPVIHLRYVHESARNFVMNLCESLGNEDYSKTRPQVFERESHRSIVKTFVDVFSNCAHPIWHSLGLNPRNWRDVLLKPYELPTWALFTPETPQWHAFDYLASHGFHHCRFAADRRSMFDPLWRDIFNRVILSSDSAFGMFLVKPGNIHQGQHGLFEYSRRGMEYPMGKDQEGCPQILPAHLLAILDIIHEDDLSVFCGKSDTGSASTTDNNNTSMLLIFEHADHVGEWSTVTALQIACAKGNCAAIRMIFQAAQPYCDNAVKSLLLNESSYRNVPLGMAIYQGRGDLARTLLELEKAATSGKDAGTNFPLPSRFVSKQWSCRATGGQYGSKIEAESLLLRASWMLLTTTFSQLLEIAQPEDIDAIIEEGKNLLHIAAINGHQGTVRVLVDMCGANPNTPSGEYRNRTAIVYAALQGHEDIVADLQDRGANNNPMLLSEWWSAYSDNGRRGIGWFADILAELRAELSFVDPATMVRLVAKARAEA